MKRAYILTGLFLVGVLGLTACTDTAAVPTTPAASAATTVAPTPAVVAESTAAPAPTTEPAAVLVNGEAIPLAEYERQMARYEAAMVAAGQDPGTPAGAQALAEARQWVLDRLIEQVLIMQAAPARGVVVSDAEVDASIQSLAQDIGQEALDQRLIAEGLTLAELKADLKREMTASQVVEQIVTAVPASAEHVNARHIVVGVEQEARQILTQIQTGADFAALAQAYSQDAFTRDRGGDLGYFPRGVLTSPEVEAVAFDLQPGQVSDVVQSALGFHIVQVLDRVAEMEVSPENLRLLKDKAVREWLDALWAQADIQRYVATTP